MDKALAVAILVVNWLFELDCHIRKLVCSEFSYSLTSKIAVTCMVLSASVGTDLCLSNFSFSPSFVH